ncbi:MAG: flavodoxin [Lawsonibacter sp.]|nr:flavodoxin [Lawsonibacter sp.]
MSTLVVFYSLDGNTQFIAQTIAGTVGADLVMLHPRKDYPQTGARKYVWGGKSVLFGETPELTNDTIDWNSYDTIFIGTPIWAGSYAPPIKTFLSQYPIQGKRIALFACHRGGGAEKCFQKLRDHLSQNVVLGEMAFTEPKRDPDQNAEKAVTWVKQLSI